MAVTGRDKFRTIGSSDVNAKQCPAGTVLVNGVCVDPNSLQALRASGGLSGTQGVTQQTTPQFRMQTGYGAPSQPAMVEPAVTQPSSTLSDIYGDIRKSLTGATEANIAASRAETQAAQSQLERQLQQQREDFLRNRQSLQRETFLRGRNVLANLANRGLATSGLQQLGDVQRTIATGQQMSELSRAFEQARQGLTAQQQAAGRAQTAFEAQQRGTLEQQLANLKAQEQQAGITDAERQLAMRESFEQLMSDPTIPQSIKENLAPYYEPFLPGVTGELKETKKPATLSDLIEGVTKTEGVEFSSGERNALNKIVQDSENLNPASPFMVALSGLPQGQQVTPTVSTKAGYAGLNDNYSLEIGGQSFTLDGKELATLIMNGQITVSPAIAVSILQGKDGSLVPVSGDQNEAIRKPYLQWLEEQGFITSRISTGAFGGQAGIKSYQISQDIKDLLR